MDEFFAPEEHQALSEPMVVEAACSSAVTDSRPRLRLVARVAPPWADSPAPVGGYHWAKPLQTAPPRLKAA